MSGRRLLLWTLAGAALVGVVLAVRRRRSHVATPSVQVGFADGSLHTLTPQDPAYAELLALAAQVRASVAVVS